VKHNKNLVQIEKVLEPYINDPDYEEGIVGDHSSKMQLLVIWVQLCLSLNEKMLIFSQWTSTLDIIETILDKHAFFAGNTPYPPKNDRYR
jgi:SNF2 family DNA or RNA helicase